MTLAAKVLDERFMPASIVRAGRERNGFRAGLDSSGGGPDCARVMPHRERYLFICTNRRPVGHSKGSCAERGSEALVPALKAAIAERGGKDRVRACASGCLDLCEIGASIVQEPDHVAYGHVTPGDIPEIADAVLKGQVVERLVVYRKSEG